VIGQNVCPGHSTAREIPWSWGLCGLWSKSECSGEEILLLLLPRFEPQIFQHISELLY